MARPLLAFAAVVALATLALSLHPGAPHASRAAVICNGMERWDIKTLSDDNADQVDLNPADIKYGAPSSPARD